MNGPIGLEERVVAINGSTGVRGGDVCQDLAGAGAMVALLGRSRERAEERTAAAKGGSGPPDAVVVDDTLPESVYLEHDRPALLDLPSIVRGSDVDPGWIFLSHWAVGRGPLTTNALSRMLTSRYHTTRAPGG